MKNLLLFFVFFAYSATCNIYALSEGYEKFQIKQGMHENTVNKKYGRPILVEKTKSKILPISKKKTLYKIDDSTFVILYFFSGRVTDVTILEDANLDEATEMFRNNS